jgi:hypothetical protein
MPSSGILRRVALVSRDLAEELSASFIRATRIGELGTTPAVTSNRRTLRRNIRHHSAPLHDRKIRSIKIRAEFVVLHVPS